MYRKVPGYYLLLQTFTKVFISDIIPLMHKEVKGAYFLIQVWELRRCHGERHWPGGRDRPQGILHAALCCSVRGLALLGNLVSFFSLDFVLYHFVSIAPASHSSGVLCFYLRYHFLLVLNLLALNRTPTTTVPICWWKSHICWVPYAYNFSCWFQSKAQFMLISVT